MAIPPQPQKDAVTYVHQTMRSFSRYFDQFTVFWDYFGCEYLMAGPGGADRNVSIDLKGDLLLGD